MAFFLIETEEESWKRILKVEIQIGSNAVVFRKQKRNPEKGYWKILEKAVAYSIGISKQKRNPEKGYWKHRLPGFHIQDGSRNRRGILKKDIESIRAVGFRVKLAHETEEESWKRILKDLPQAVYHNNSITKQKRNPEKGYWKCFSASNSTLKYFLKQKRNPEKGYWKLLKPKDLMWAIRRNRRGILKKDIERAVFYLLLSIYLHCETEEESWKRILKAWKSLWRAEKHSC